MVRLSGALSGARRRVPTWKRGYDSDDDGLSPCPPPHEHRGAVGSSTPHQHISPLGPRRGGGRNGLAARSGNLRESISALGRANRAALDKVDKALRVESFDSVEFGSTHPIWSASPRGAKRVEATAADSMHAEAEKPRMTEASPTALLRLLVSEGPHAGSLCPFRTLLRRLLTGAKERAFGLWKIRARVKQQVTAKVEKMLQRLVNRSQFEIRALQAWGSLASEKSLLKRKSARFALSRGHTAKKKSWVRWMRQVQFQGEAVARMIKTRLSKALARWSHQSAVVCLAAWHQRAQYRKRLEAKEANIMLRVLKRLLRTSYKSWENQVQSTKRLKGHALRVVQRLVTTLMVRAFETWFVSAVEEAQLRNKASMVIRRIIGNTLAKGFDSWRDDVRKRKNLATTAIRAVHTCINRKLARALLQWKKSNVIERHQLYSEAVRGTILMMANVLRRFFTQWQYLHAEKTWLRARIVMVVKRWNNQALLHTFRKWHTCLVIGICLQDLTHQISVRNERLSLAKAFACLTSCVEEWKRRRMNLIRASKLRSGRMQASVSEYMNRWYCSVAQRTFHETRRKALLKGIQLFLKQLQGFNARSALHAWREGAERAQCKVSEARGVALRRQKWSIAFYVSSWHEYVLAVSREKAREVRKTACIRGVHGIVARLLYATLASAFQHWCCFVERLRSGTSMAMKLVVVGKKRWAGSCLRQWCECTRQDRDKNNAEGYRERRLNWQISSRAYRCRAFAYHQWSIRCKDRQGIAIALRRSAAKRKTVVMLDNLLEWSDFVRVRARRHENMDRLAALLSRLSQRLSYLYVSYVYRKWFDCTLQGRSNGRNAKRMLHARSKRWRSRCLDKWREYAMLQGRKRIALEKLIYRTAQHALSFALVRWCHFVAKKRWQKVVTADMLSRVWQRALLTAFDKWRQGLEEEHFERDRRAKEERVEEIVRRHICRKQKASIQMSWSTWRVLTIENVATRCC